MTPYLVRIELRRRWPALLLLGVIAAVVVTLSLASLAGARRAESAFDRYLDRIDAPEAMVQGEADALAALDDLTPVDEAIAVDLVAIHPRDAGPEDFFPFFAPEDEALPARHYRLPVVDGRSPDPTKPYEVALSERTAARLDLGVGEAIEMISWSPEAAALVGSSEETGPDGPSLRLRVVGILRDPGDIGARATDITFTFLTPAFREEHGPATIGSIGGGAFVALRDGYDLGAFADAAGPDIEIDTTLAADSFRGQIQPTMGTIATSLRVFAAIVAFAGLIALVQAAARLQTTAHADDAALAALGAGRGTRALRLTLPSGFAIAAGVAAGMGGAVLLSPRFPIGLARRADPDLGLHLDLPVLVVGGALFVLVIGALLAAAAVWQLRPTADRTSHPASAARLAARVGASPAAVTGLSLAGGPSGARSGLAIGGTVLGVLGVLATLVFAASVEHLREDPGLYGWGWDANVEGHGLTDLGAGADDIGTRLAADRDVDGLATLYTQLPITVDGEPDLATAIIPRDGTFSAAVVEGDEPVRANEIAVGRTTLGRIHASVGDQVEVRFLDEQRTMRIAGVVAIYVPEDGGSLSSGTLLSPATFTSGELDAACDESEDCSRALAVDLAESVSPEEFAARYEDPEADVSVALPAPPSDIDRLTAVEDLPRYLAAFLAVLGAVAISFATATTMRERRRDLAVLRVLGMTGRHLRSVVTTFVLALTITGAVAGIALGLVVGRQVWRVISSNVAVPFAPSLPLAAAVLVPVAAVLLAQIVATRSRQRVARIPAARVLRAE